MEASSAQKHKEKEQPPIHRPCAFDKMEELVREMQDPENGVPVRSQKLFLTSIPSAFMGYDLIEWLMERLNIEESVEAVHIANQLCQYGYFFPVNDSRTLTVKDDSSLYRFQIPYYWPWQNRPPDNVEYAIYLAKRTLRNKQRHGLEDYELEALNNLKKNLQNKWDIIQLQAEEQVRLSKERKKGDKIVSDSQERAFWRVCRPPPGCLNSFDAVPLPLRAWPGLPRPPPRKRTLNDVQREVELLRNSLTRTRVKFSVAVENLKTYFETYVEYDPMMTQPQPSNPWITDDITFWQLNSALVEVPTEKRVKRWSISLEELMSDPTGLQEFTNYLRKEYSHENIRFWLAVKDLRHSFQAKINDKVNEIFREFLAPGAPCEINIDGKTMEKVHQEMKNPTRFTFDSAAEHVYTLLLKKDCYPRFIRSDHYRNLLAAGVQPLQKKRFFNFGGPGKKKLPASSALALGSSMSQPQQQQQHGITSGSGISGIAMPSAGGRRRGSDRSLSGSAHELAICGVRESAAPAPRVPHSHSQSNLTDIPYRGDLHFKIPSRPSPSSAQDAGAPEAAAAARPMDDVCPWDVVAPASTSIATTVTTASSSTTTIIATVSSSAAASSSRTPSAESGPPLGPATTGPEQPQQQQQQATTSAASSSYRPPRSRKNSSQLDSCSSSSDLSGAAIAEVSERLRKTGPEQQQQQQHQHHHPHHHHHHHHYHHHHQPQQSQQQQQGTPAIQRNYSVGSVQPVSSGPSGGVRVKLSEMPTRASVSTCNFPSPQHSFDLSYGTQRAQLQHQAASLAELQASAPSPAEPLPEESVCPPERQRELQVQLHTVRSTKAPLISISAIVGELPEEPLPTDEETVTDTPDTSSDCALMSEPLTQTQSAAEVTEEQLPPNSGEVAAAAASATATTTAVDPTREPDTRLQDQPQPSSSSSSSQPQQQQQQQPSGEPSTSDATTSKEQRDNNVNEVCPWEDEENCRVDAPYVKTYATLGYL